MKQKNDMPQRKSPRAHWLDYNDGRYFVTVCTRGHHPFFGNIENDVMILTEVGMFLDNELKNVSSNHPHVEVIQYVIMPNHFHAIIKVGTHRNASVDSIRNEIVGTHRNASVDSIRNEIVGTHRNASEKNGDITNTTDALRCVPTGKGHQRPLLSTCLGGIKSAVTRYANTHNIPFAWQPRYHDHAIRDHHDYGNISDYIAHNVLNWSNDCFNLYKTKK